MTTMNRRTILRATGASLLGSTFTSTAAEATPHNEAGALNESVTLIEVCLAFDFGDATDLDVNHSDRPTKYGIDPERGILDVRTVTAREAKALTSGQRLLNFQGIDADVDSFGGTTVTSLPRITGGRGIQSTYVHSEDGYEMPEFEIDWDAEPYPQLLSPGSVLDVSAHDGFIRARLPRQSVDVRTKRVLEPLVEDEKLPAWKRSHAIDRSRTTVEVTPSLTVALHRDLTVVDSA